MDNQSAVEAEVGGTPFKFSLAADATGVTELVFVKDAQAIFSVLLTALDAINQTFATPYKSVGDFARMLGTVADDIDGARNAGQEDQEHSQSAAD